MNLIHTTILTQQQKNDIATLVNACKEQEPLALSAPGEEGLDYFLLYDREISNILLGFAFLFFPEPNRCECSVFVHPDYRRKGLCSCMLNQVLEQIEQKEKKESFQIDFCFLVDSSTPSAMAVMEALEAEYWYSEYKMVRRRKESDRLYTCALKIEETEPGIYTASLEDKLIGTCAILPSNQECYLYAFQIKESYQGHGYGKDFLLGMLALLPQDYGQVSIQVSGQNYIARNLYKKTGFQTVESLSYYLY